MSRLKGVELRELWRARVRRFESLDQTVAEFCQWEGVSIAAFYVWRKKLREVAAPKHRTPLTAKSGDTHRRPLFVPIVSSSRPVEATGAVVVMTLSDGTRVELPANGNSTFVAAVFSRLNAATGTGVCLLPAFPSCDCFLRKI